MGFFDALSDLVSAASPWTEHEAEAPTTGGSSDVKTPANDEAGEGEAKDPSGPTPDKKDMSDETVSGKEASGNDAEEEEEEEEPVDPKEELENECKESKQCSPAKHHYDECVERVTAAESDGNNKEDCVEEFFHLAHCATACAAPKLWAALK